MGASERDIWQGQLDRCEKEIYNLEITVKSLKDAIIRDGLTECKSCQNMWQLRIGNWCYFEGITGARCRDQWPSVCKGQYYKKGSPHNEIESQETNEIN